MARSLKKKSATGNRSFAELERNVASCELCPRLRRHCAEIARVKKRQFRDQNYWGKPVPGFGDEKARVWIVGLAPAAHGANRTGRMFTGDSSGDWLYRALHRCGFANQAESTAKTDGLTLTDVYVSSAGRCAPPDNKPLPLELKRCAPFLEAEFRLLENVRLIVALGAIGFQAVLRLLASQGVALPDPKPVFGHGKFYRVGKYGLLASYHPSRQNTQTGRLTEPMWREIFDFARTACRA